MLIQFGKSRIYSFITKNIKLASKLCENKHKLILNFDLLMKSFVLHNENY